MVLGVLCGLFSMHGVTASCNPLMVMTQGVDSLASYAPSTLDSAALMPSASRSVLSPDTGGRTPSGTDLVTAVEHDPPGGVGSHSVMELCLAALGAAAVLLLLVGLRTRRPHSFVAAAQERTRWRRSHSSSRVFALSPVQLCLSRT